MPKDSQNGLRAVVPDLQNTVRKPMPYSLHLKPTVGPLSFLLIMINYLSRQQCFALLKYV